MNLWCVPSQFHCHVLKIWNCFFVLHAPILSSQVFLLVTTYYHPSFLLLLPLIYQNHSSDLQFPENTTTFWWQSLGIFSNLTSCFSHSFQFLLPIPPSSDLKCFSGHCQWSSALAESFPVTSPAKNYHRKAHAEPIYQLPKAREWISPSYSSYSV